MMIIELYKKAFECAVATFEETNATALNQISIDTFAMAGFSQRDFRLWSRFVNEHRARLRMLSLQKLESETLT